jgi:hypothetical protein
MHHPTKTANAVLINLFAYLNAKAILAYLYEIFSMHFFKVLARS